MTDLSEKMKKATVGIAGLGGLGSTVAVALARTGVGKLIIADFDRVEKSNLNRQHYFIDQIGQYKTDALAANLQRINPDVKVVSHKLMLNKENIPHIFADACLVAECFDESRQKKMIVETVLTKMKDVPIVTVSGLAGYGKSNEITTKRLSDRLILIGDQTSGTDKGLPLTAARVWLAASHQANAIVEVLLDEILK